MEAKPASLLYAQVPSFTLLQKNFEKQHSTVDSLEDLNVQPHQKPIQLVFEETRPPKRALSTVRLPCTFTVCVYNRRIVWCTYLIYSLEVTLMGTYHQWAWSCQWQKQTEKVIVCSYLVEFLLGLLAMACRYIPLFIFILKLTAELTQSSYKFWIRVNNFNKIIFTPSYNCRNSTHNQMLSQTCRRKCHRWRRSVVHCSYAYTAVTHTL